MYLGFVRCGIALSLLLKPKKCFVSQNVPKRVRGSFKFAILTPLHRQWASLALRQKASSKYGGPLSYNKFVKQGPFLCRFTFMLVSINVKRQANGPLQKR